MRRKLCPMEEQLLPRDFYKEDPPLSPELGFRWLKDIFLSETLVVT